MKKCDERRTQYGKKIKDLEKNVKQRRSLAKRKLEDQLDEEEDPENLPYSAGHY